MNQKSLIITAILAVGGGAFWYMNRAKTAKVKAETVDTGMPVVNSPLPAVLPAFDDVFGPMPWAEPMPMMLAGTETVQSATAAAAAKPGTGISYEEFFGKKERTANHMATGGFSMP